MSEAQELFGNPHVLRINGKNVIVDKNNFEAFKASIKEKYDIKIID